jgi:hypothetical protein
VIHAGLFDIPKAHLTPVSYGHFLDEQVFDGRLRLKLVRERFAKFVEAVARFSFEYDRPG